MEPEQLSMISRRYPYFSAVQLLLTKSLQQAGDYRFADQLHQAAIYSGDRKILYHWVKEIGKQQERAALVVPLGTITAEAKAVEVITETIPTAEETKDVKDATADLASLIVDEEISKSTEEATIQVTTLSPQIVEEIDEPSIEPEAPAATISESESSTSNAEALNRDILIEAIQSSIASEVMEATPTKTAAESEPAHQLETPVDVDSYASYMLKRSRQLHFGEGTVFHVPEQASSIEVSDWMRVALEEIATTEAEEIEREEIENSGTSEHTGASHGVERIKRTDAQVHQKELIDRFISFEPQIARGKAVDYTPGNVAKESLEEDFSMITETIAQLYAQQGKTNKARKAYKKLMSLYPEKSVYFAAQLKNLDKYKK